MEKASTATILVKDLVQLSLLYWGLRTKLLIADIYTLLARITPCLENGKTAFVHGIQIWLFGRAACPAGSPWAGVAKGKRVISPIVAVLILSTATLISWSGGGQSVHYHFSIVKWWVSKWYPPEISHSLYLDKVVVPILRTTKIAGIISVILLK